MVSNLLLRAAARRVNNTTNSLRRQRYDDCVRRSTSSHWRYFSATSSDEGKENLERPIPFTASWWSLPSPSPAESQSFLSPTFSSAWWWARIPKGFENFGVNPDDDAKTEGTNDGTSTSKTGTTTTSHSNSNNSSAKETKSFLNSEGNKKENNNRRRSKGGRV